MVLREITISVVRGLVSAACGTWIAAIVQSGAATEWQVVAVIGGAVTLLVNIAWSVGEKLLRRWNFEAALQVPEQTTPKELQQIVDQVSTVTRISQAFKSPALAETVKEELDKTQ